MSDPKRATLITVGATKSEKTKSNKTVRLNINLVESNESKYPELNYKELVSAEEEKKIVENGKTEGLNPFSDNDDDVERVARKFEQKYGGNSTYGTKGRSKQDDFADIGAGYDENDSFIDNTDGYDEMIPPECDTLYGGFYINSGSLEFKNVERCHSDGDDDIRGRRNKRRISSSSSDDDSSDSSSDSDSQDEKAPMGMVNGNRVSHHTEHRKKKNKKDKIKPNKIRRTDSSAANSGKQTSDDNNHADAETDSRTSQSDSLTSKPAPSSDNPVTSDSSRDDLNVEVTLPPQVMTLLEELETVVSQIHMENPTLTAKEIEMKTEPYVMRLERSVCNESGRVRRLCWSRAARVLRAPRPAAAPPVPPAPQPTDNHTDYVSCPASATPSTTPPLPAPPPSTTPPLPTPTPAPAVAPAPAHKRKHEADEPVDVAAMTDDEREAKVVETLLRLKALIDERTPSMLASYNAECERVQEERKKIQIASADGAPVIEKRLPKRRFPWCGRTRALLARLVRLSRAPDAAAALLARRALPLFPAGFVRMPTLLRQADLSKELKVSELKRQRLGSSSQPQPTTIPIQFPEQIHFPSSLTVTTTMKPSFDKNEISISTEDKDKHKTTSIFGTIVNTYTLNKDLVLEKEDRKRDTEKKEDLYVPPNNIGSITITPVINSQPKPSNTEKKSNHVSVIEKNKDTGLIRIKSPAALNEMIHKQEKVKALENIHKRDKDKHKKEKEGVKIHNSHLAHHSNIKEKRIDTPLHIDTNFQPKTKEPTPSPKNKDEITKKQIENMRVAENNIPRPVLVPVGHSPTFAKPDKRPPEVKKKKDLVIVSDLDPLCDLQTEPVSVDDSSSDVEVVEDSKSEKGDSVPSKDNVSVREVNHKKDYNMLVRRDNEKRSDKLDEATKEDFDSVMKNLRDLEHSQEAAKFNSSSYGGVITSEQTSLNKMDGCNAVTG